MTSSIFATALVVLTITIIFGLLVQMADLQSKVHRTEQERESLLEKL